MPSYFANMAAYSAAVDAPAQRIGLQKASVTTVAFREYALWRATGLPAPGAGFYGTTPVTCGAATVGAMPIVSSTSILRVVRAWFDFATKGFGSVMLHDRLIHNSGLSGIVTTAVTINTPALPARAGAGEGVKVAVESWGTIGATATTLRMSSYTNSAGTPGQSGPGITFGSTGWRDPPRFLPLSLAPGDTGVQSLETTTLLATTGTVGDYGITMYKTLLTLPVNTLLQRNPEDEGIFGLGGVMPVVDNDACLFQTIVWSTTSTGAMAGYIDLAEVP